MNSRTAYIIFTLSAAILTLWSAEIQGQRSAVLIPSGSFHSVLPEVEGEPISVEEFFLDKTAVTNKQFVEFLQSNGEWMKSNIPAVYTRDGYLRHWQSDLDPGPEQIDDAPVTRVSWFAANADRKSVV